MNNESPMNSAAPDRLSPKHIFAQLVSGVRALFSASAQRERAVTVSKNIAWWKVNSTEMDALPWQMIWEGTQGEFNADMKRVVSAAITQRLDRKQQYAFRAIGQSELKSILALQRIGGNDYSGTVIEDGALFSTGVVTALCMFDGRKYFGGDDRNEGGFLLVISPGAVDNEVFTLHRPISLDEVAQIFRVKRFFDIDRDPSQSLYEVYELPSV